MPSDLAEIRRLTRDGADRSYDAEALYLQARIAFDDRHEIGDAGSGEVRASSLGPGRIELGLA